MTVEIKWIPVTEDLPEADKQARYFVTKHYAVDDSYETDIFLWWNGWNRTKGDDGKYEIKDKVVAWAYPPEPWMPFTAEELRREKQEEDARDVALEMGRDE